MKLHAELLHDANGRSVLSVRRRGNSGDTKFLETSVNQRARPFRRVPVPPGCFSEAVADRHVA